MFSTNPARSAASVLPTEPLWTMPSAAKNALWLNVAPTIRSGMKYWPFLNQTGGLSASVIHWHAGCKSDSAPILLRRWPALHSGSSQRLATGAGDEFCVRIAARTADGDPRPRDPARGEVLVLRSWELDEQGHTS